MMEPDYLTAIARSPNFPAQLREQAVAMLEVVGLWRANPAMMARGMASACAEAEWRKRGGGDA